MSRHTTFTHTIGLRVIEQIRKGMPVVFAAAAAGVPRATLYRWLAAGEAEKPSADDESLVAFAALYRAAEAEYAAQELASIDGEVGEGKGDWKRTAWKLEKRFPKEFGSRVALEHSGPDGAPMQHQVTARVVVLPPVHDPANRDDSVEPEPGAADGVPEQPG